MSTLTSDRKLELLRQIRQENQSNQMKIKSREAFLYGGERAYENPYHSYEWERQLGEGAPETQERQAVSSFRVRLILALLLFAAFFYMDKTDYHVGNLNSSYVVQQIQDTGGSNMFAFISRLPYTKED